MKLSRSFHMFQINSYVHSGQINPLYKYYLCKKSNFYKICLVSIYLTLKNLLSTHFSRVKTMNSKGAIRKNQIDTWLQDYIFSKNTWTIKENIIVTSNKGFLKTLIQTKLNKVQPLCWASAHTSVMKNEPLGSYSYAKQYYRAHSNPRLAAAAVVTNSTTRFSVERKPGTLLQLSHILEGFNCTFSLSISLSITLQISKFRNQFTISSKYFDLVCYLKRDLFWSYLF